MIDVSLIGLATAFAGGLISFLSPCVLPLVPAYVSYVGGKSMQTADERVARPRLSAAGLSVFFVLGFSTVFVALGASASALGQLMLQYRHQANVIGGIIVIVFGLAMLGLARRNSWFNRDLRFHPSLAGGHPGGAFVLGFAFGFGWTPCIGPVLGAILTLSAVQTSLFTGTALLAAYALGLGVPFVLSALFMDKMVAHLKWLRPAGRRLQIAAGVVMIVMGAAMITGRLSTFAFWLLEVFPALGRIG